MSRLILRLGTLGALLLGASVPAAGRASPAAPPAPVAPVPPVAPAVRVPPAPAVPVATSHAQHGDADGPIRASAAVKGPISFRLETASAEVEVVSGPPGQVTLEVDDAHVGEVKLLMRGEDRMEVEFDGRPRLISGSVRLTLPPGGNVDISAVSGDVAVKGVGGEARVRTASGDVHLSGPAKADVRTISGDVSIREARSEARVRTVSGDAVVSMAGTPAPRLEFESTSGHLDWNGVCAKGCRLEARTASGDVSFHLGERSSFGLQYASHSGDLEDGLKLSTTKTQTTVIGSTVTEGRFAQGEGLIECSTFSGDLELKRR